MHKVRSVTIDVQAYIFNIYIIGAYIAFVIFITLDSTAS